MCNWPHIPSYSDSENTFFHPVFFFALETVLKRRNIEDVEIIPQFPTASGPVDFALRRKSTGKIIIPIEMKRTQSGVRGLGRRQARDYQHNVASFAETSFYCVSNLELTELFNADIHRQTTLSQKIALSSPQDALLDHNQEEKIKSNLLAVIDEIVDIVFFNRRFSYATGLTNLECSLRNISNGTRHWHENLLPFCFEYIRGTPRLAERTKHWKPASSYKNIPGRLIDLGGRIDFKGVFSPPVSLEEHFDVSVLQDAYDSGKLFGDGDDISALIGDILFDPQNGAVETDFDLARLLAIAAKSETEGFSNDDAILDPCAGSGRLLAAAIQERFPTISPKNIIAVEQEPRFLEALCLRLGLQFGLRISPDDSPTIKICPFESVDPNILAHVRIALVNPPFMSGVKSVDKKKILLKRIQDISGKPSIVGAGQIGYEAVFMELLWHVLPEGSTIAFIFPYQVLSRLSSEMAKLRSFLAKDFAVSTIILYPKSGVFESVVKKTAIFIGHKGVPSETIRIIEIQIPVPDVDFSKFKEHLENENVQCYGVSDLIVPQKKLVADAAIGWQRNICVSARANPLLLKLLENNSFGVSPEGIRRGTMGDSGNTALTVMTRQNLHPYVPRKWIVGAINNAKNMPSIITAGNAPNLSFIPPEDVKNKKGRHFNALIKAVSAYIEETNGQFSTKKQKTSQKTLEGIVKDIGKDQRDPAFNSILIPRACREEAKLSIVDNDPVLVSTNFLIIPVEDRTVRLLMGSWLKSVFGQLQLEMLATSQEGMRKLEKKALLRLRFPDMEKIGKEQKDELMDLFVHEPFLDLSEVQHRKSDVIWANLLDASNSSVLLEQTVLLLQEHYDERVQ
jgi:hypothetical protein